MKSKFQHAHANVSHISISLWDNPWADCPGQLVIAYETGPALGASGQVSVTALWPGGRMLGQAQLQNTYSFALREAVAFH